MLNLFAVKNREIYVTKLLKGRIIMAYGLVFDGGGARGAFHIGVWRALKEQNIDVSVVCGASIGAINAALYIMDDLDKAYEIWSKIDLSDVILMPEGIKVKEDLFDVRNLPAIARQIKNKKGLDPEPLKKLLKENISEEKIRGSQVEFGLVAYSITHRKEEELYINDIPEGELLEYIMASACFPGFKAKEINKSLFIDGGVANNMPVNMLIKKGIKDIITVDVKGVGFYKDFNTAGTNIINVSCKKPYVGTLEFNSDGIKKSIEEGYLETKRAFGELCGKNYFFTNESFINARKKYSTQIIDGIESGAQILDIERLKVWDFNELCSQVTTAFSKVVLTNEIIAQLNSNKADIHRIFELVKDEQRLALLVKLLQKNGYEYLKGKAPKAMGEMYKAANAILYFL